MLDRRRFLAGVSGLGAATAFRIGTGHAAPDFSLASMRGAIDAGEFGVRPARFDDQSKTFQAMLDRAAERGIAIHLPAGDYVVSNIDLPAAVHLSGVPGASRIVYGGDGHLFAAEDAEHIELEGVELDGANRWLGDHVQGLLDARRARHLVVDNCRVTGSGKNGLALEKCGGRITRSTLSGAADAALYAVESTGLSVTGNVVADCANGGILIHRWQPGEDGTIVTGNRVARIGAVNGGTGQYGNGINVFRAAGVIVADNHVSDCAFSTIRANSASNIQIRGNTCLRAGETSIYAEFAFEGAVIASNIVDGAANGISIVNFNEGGRIAVCSGNIVRNMATEGPYPADPPGFGVGIAVEADCAVTGNVVENAPRYGMHFGWGEFMRNIAATGNVVRKAGEGIAVSVVEGNGSVLIADNVFDAVPGGAVVGHRWTEAVTGDLTKESTSRFPNLTVVNNSVR
ncbi:MAG: TIGR03808 family TAT-translocated repetitive protein [Rhizobiaceae bacterium]|nr:TIGR03808 family TAT-translocated repetitive protein [Rhizobiaceae bacterium]MCV0405542.1 TIGR03808 family TAT-translocated repetitive protein [Rhizobiaceae bacterium]